MGGSLTKGQGARPISEGNYVFADLEELDGIIAEWTTIRDRVEGRGNRLAQAIGLITPPAEDVMSRIHAGYTQASLQKALKHNDAMSAYARTYVEKLRAARAQYAESDTQAAAAIKRSGEG